MASSGFRDVSEARVREERLPDVRSYLGLADLVVEGYGSICLLRAQTAAGEEWVEENVGGGESLAFAGAVVVEPRYVEAILCGARDAGLTVGDDEYVHRSNRRRKSRA